MLRLPLLALAVFAAIGCATFPDARLVTSHGLTQQVAAPVVCGPMGFRRTPLQARWGEYLRVTVQSTAVLEGAVRVHANGVALEPRAWRSDVDGEVVLEARFENLDPDARFALSSDRPVDVTLSGLAAPQGGTCEGAVFTVEQGALVPSVDERAWVAELERRGGPELAARRAARKAEQDALRAAHYAAWEARRVDASPEVLAAADAIRRAHYAVWEAERLARRAGLSVDAQVDVEAGVELAAGGESEPPLLAGGAADADLSGAVSFGVAGDARSTAAPPGFIEAPGSPPAVHDASAALHGPEAHARCHAPGGCPSHEACLQASGGVLHAPCPSGACVGCTGSCAGLTTLAAASSCAGSACASGAPAAAAPCASGACVGGAGAMTLPASSACPPGACPAVEAAATPPASSPCLAGACAGAQSLPTAPTSCAGAGCTAGPLVAAAPVPPTPTCAAGLCGASAGVRASFDVAAEVTASTPDEWAHFDAASAWPQPFPARLEPVAVSMESRVAVGQPAPPPPCEDDFAAALLPGAFRMLAEAALLLAPPPPRVVRAVPVAPRQP